MERQRREAIWSVREGTRTAYVIVFTVLFGTGMGLTVAAGGGDPDRTLLQTVVAYWNMASGMAIAAAAGSMLAVEPGGSIMVLLDRALDARDARRKAYREEGRELGLAEGLAEGLDKGRAEGRAKREQEMRQELMAWYERLEAARRDGRAFDEPPPFIDANGRSDNGRPA